MTTNQNNSVSPYIRLQLDDSFIDKCFQHVDKKFVRHEELINEIMRLLKNKANMSDLENLQNSIFNILDEKIENKITEKLSSFENKIDEKINQTKSDLESKLNDSIEKITTSFDEKIKELNEKFNQLSKLSEFGENIQQQFNDLKESMKIIEKNLEKEKAIQQTHQSAINSIILSIGSLNGQDLSENILNSNESMKRSKSGFQNEQNDNEDDLDSNSDLNKLHNLELTHALTTSTKYVNDELNDLKEELQRIKDEMQIQSIMNRQSQTSLPPIVIPSSPKSKPSPQPSPKSPTVQKSVTKIIKMKDTTGPNFNDFLNGHHFIEFDFLSKQPYKQPTVHWTDPPELPKIEQFRDMSSFVDYFYRLVPKLQAHLTSLHQKITENSSELLGKCDKVLAEKMFDKFQSIVNEMKKRLNDLKDAVELTASREEINQMVDDMLARMGSDSETAAGCVKCIACGREVAIVAGARTEKELHRTLGLPPNSIVQGSQNRTVNSSLSSSIAAQNFLANGNIGAAPKSSTIKVMYTGREGFDSEIIESPRAIRPARMKSPH